MVTVVGVLKNYRVLQKCVYFLGSYCLIDLNEMGSRLGLFEKHGKEWSGMENGVEAEWVERGVFKRLKSWSGYR